MRHRRPPVPLQTLVQASLHLAPICNPASMLLTRLPIFQSSNLCQASVHGPPTPDTRRAALFVFTASRRRGRRAPRSRRSCSSPAWSCCCTR
eukprot:5019357-Prymnesium_polylepis.1